MKKLIIILGFCPILFSCAETKSDKKETPAVKAATTETDEVILTPEQIKNAAIEVGTPELKEMQRTLRVNGTVDVPPQNMASVSVPLGGYLKSMNLLPGMAVKKGALLARMEDQQYIQLQQDYLVGKSRLQYLEADYQRQKGLNETKAISDKTFQQVQSEYQSQRVLVNALSEKLRLIGINPQTLNEEKISRSIGIYAPVSGYVNKVNFNIGKYVNPTDVLLELINPSDIHVSLTVFEKDVPYISVGQRVLCYTNSNPVKKYVAKVLLVNQSIDNDRASEVHCHLEQYDKDLRPGMFMNAEIELTNASLTAVPDDAIVRWQNKHYVFAAEAGNKFVLTPVEPGDSHDGYTAINSELAGKKVVVRNAYTLLMHMKNGGEEE